MHYVWVSYINSEDQVHTINGQCLNNVYNLPSWVEVKLFSKLSLLMFLRQPIKYHIWNEMDLIIFYSEENSADQWRDAYSSWGGHKCVK